MKVIIFAALFVFVNAVQINVPAPGKNGTICASVNFEGQLLIKAMDGNKTVATKTLPFSGATLLEESDCDTIKMNMGNNVQVWFKRSVTAGVQKVQPIAAFAPVVVVPEAENTTAVFDAVEFGSFASNQSYKCVAALQHIFKASTMTNLTYDVTASTTNLQIQFGDLKDKKFSTDVEECSQDTPTTTEKPTTTIKPTTPAPVDYLLNVNVTNKYKNVTCILLQGEFEVSVTHENETVNVKVPSTAVATGNCSLNTTTSNIKVSFLNDWNMEMFFMQSEKDTTTVYQIQVTYNTSIFKDVKPEMKTVTLNTPSDFLKATSEGYYQCNTNTTLVDNQSNVTLTSSDLKYKAFNTDPSPDFNSGDVAECPADEETSSVVPIAVGAALAGLVVIVLIAYLIGRRRSRKQGYESV